MDVHTSFVVFLKPLSVLKMLEALNKVVIGENPSSSRFPVKIKKLWTNNERACLLGFIQGPYNWEKHKHLWEQQSGYTPED